MESEPLKDRLIAAVATLETRTDGELISLIREALVAAGTGTPIEDLNEQYQVLYSELDSRLSAQGVEHDNHFDSLWDFHSYWKENGLDTYASRRSYVKSLYQKTTTSDPLWHGINPVIKDVAKSRFDSGHRADAVEAAFKEINSRIKEFVRQRTGEELDGASLMNHAFSPSKPIIILDDLETEDGRSIQQGYMQMFAGSMIGVRNPKAHANIEIEKEEAISWLHLASNLLNKFESATKNSQPAAYEEAPSKRKRGLYVLIENPDDQQKLLKLKEVVTKHAGDDPVILVLGAGKRSAIKLLMKVAFSDALTKELVKAFGEKNVVTQQ